MSNNQAQPSASIKKTFGIPKRKKTSSKEPSELDPKTVISLASTTTESLFQTPKDKRHSFLGGAAEKKYKLFSKSNSRTSLPSTSRVVREQSSVADKNEVAGDIGSGAFQSTSTLETKEMSDRKESPAEQDKDEADLSVYQVGDIVIAVKKHYPQELNEIQVHPGDLIEVAAIAKEQDFWLIGTNLVDGNRNGQTGYVPKSYVRANWLSQTSRMDESKENCVHSSGPPDTGTEETLQHVIPGTQAVAKYSYEKSKNDEISFNSGDTIVVLNCIDGGWWRGINTSVNGSNVVGWFPVKYISILSNEVDKVLPTPSRDNDANPATMKNFKKRLITTPTPSLQIMRDRTSSAPVISVDESSPSSLLPTKNEDIFSDDDEFDSTLMKAKSFAEDYNCKNRQSVGQRYGRRGSAAEIHFEILQELIAAKVETLHETLGDEVYHSLSEKERKRLHGVLELVQTERDYVRDLVIIIEIFLKPMNSLTTIGAKNSALLFANIEQITAINYKFLSQMLELKITDTQAFAELFLSNMENFMCYIPYCANQNVNWEKMTKPILNKADIKQFLKDAHRNPILRLLNIQGFLVKPVQRVCKYPLFLKEMIKNTPDGHQDLIILNRAMEKVEQALFTINESAKQLNGFKSLLDIQARFTEKLSITNSSRFLLREDAVTAIYANSYTKARRIMLFNDLIIICKNNHWNSKKLYLVEKVPLKDIRLYEVIDEEATAIMEMEIIPQFESDSTKHYVFAFSSKAEKQIWITSYKSLMRAAVKVKNIKEVLFIESNADEEVDAKSVETMEIHELSEKAANLEKEIALKAQIMQSVQSQSAAWEKKCGELETELEGLKSNAGQIAEIISKDVMNDHDSAAIDSQSKLYAQAQKETALIDQEKIIAIADHARIVHERDIQIETLKSEFQILSEYHLKELEFAKEQLAKAKQDMEARAESKENLTKAFNDQMIKLGSLATNEDSLKNQVLELNVQIASLELLSSQAQNQVQNEKKDLLTMLETNQQELFISEKKVKDLEECFIEDTKILERELNHLQKELADETKHKNKEFQNGKGLLSKIDSLEQQLLVLSGNDSKAAQAFQDQAKEIEILVSKNSELNIKFQELIQSYSKREGELDLKLKGADEENSGLIMKLEVSTIHLQEALSNVKRLDESQNLLVSEKQDFLNHINSLESERMLRQEDLKRVEQALEEKTQIVKSIESEKHAVISMYEANIEKLLKNMHDTKDDFDIERRAFTSEISNLTDINKNYESALRDSSLKIENAENTIITLMDKIAEKDALIAAHSDQLNLKMAILETTEINMNTIQESLIISEQKLAECDSELRRLRLINNNDTVLLLEHKNTVIALETEKSGLQLMNTELAEKISRLTDENQCRLKESELKMKIVSSDAQNERNEYQNRLAEKDKQIFSLEQKQKLSERNFSSELSAASAKLEILEDSLKCEADERSRITNELTGRILSFTEQSKALKEEHNQAIFDLTNRVQVLQTETDIELKEKAIKIQDLTDLLGVKDEEVKSLQSRLLFQTETAKAEENKLNNEFMKAQARDNKLINELKESSKLIEKQLIALNVKLIESEATISILKESLTYSQTKTCDDLKSKEELLKAKDDAITDLENTQFSLQATCSSVEEKLISVTVAFDKMKFERDTLQIESNTLTSQISVLHIENSQLSTKVVELGNVNESKISQIAAIESQLLYEKATFESERVELQDKLLEKDSTISALKSKIIILEMSLEEDILKLSSLEYNPSPNPKELLNSHILRKKWEDKYLIATETVSRLEKDLQQSIKSANERLKRSTEDGRLKLEIGSKAIAALEVKIEKYIKTIEALKLENSATVSKLMSTTNSLEVAQSYLMDKENSLKGIFDEKHQLMITISNTTFEMTNLSTHLNNLRISSSIEIESLSSTIKSLEAEKKQLKVELESSTNAQTAITAAHELEKHQLLIDIKLLNRSIQSNESDRIKEESNFSLEKMQLNRIIQSTQDELKASKAELGQKIIEIDNLSTTLVKYRSSNDNMKSEIRKLNQAILSLNQDVFTARTVLKMEKASCESGLGHQLESMHISLKVMKKRELMSKIESDKLKLSLELERNVSNSTIEKQSKSIESFKSDLKRESEHQLSELSSFKKLALETEVLLKDEVENLKSAKLLLENEKRSLLQTVTKLESTVTAEKDVNEPLLKNADDLRKTIASLSMKISELEEDRGTLVEGYEKSIASKTGTVGFLEQKVKILQESLGSDFTKGLNNLQQIAESEKKLLIAEKKTLEVEKQVIQQEKFNLSRELESLLSSKEQSVLELTIKMKDVQQKLRTEIEIAQKQIQEVNDLYLKEREQHLNTEKAFRDVSALKNELEAKLSSINNVNKSLEFAVEELKLQLNDFKTGAARDLLTQETNYNKQLLLKSSKIEGLHSKNAKLGDQIYNLKNELDSLRDDLAISRCSKNVGIENKTPVDRAESKIQVTKKRIQQLEREKGSISLEAAQSHSNEVRLLNVINDKSIEIRNVMRRIIELEAMNDRLNGPVRRLKKVAEKTSPDSDMERKVKFLKHIIQKTEVEMDSLKNALSEICKVLKIQFTWQAMPVSSLLQETKELLNGEINLESFKRQDMANTQLLLQIIDGIKSLSREKERFHGECEKQRDFINEIGKQQRLSNLKLEQSHDIIIHLQSKLENKMLPGEKLSRRGSPKEFKQARTVAQYEVLEKLFQTTTSTLSNCQSQIIELNLEKTELEKAFKELYEQMISEKDGFMHQSRLTMNDHDSTTATLKSEIDRLNSIITGLRKHTARLQNQQTL